MARPGDVLSVARRILGEDGTLLVADGLVAEEFTVPASRRGELSTAGVLCPAYPALWETRGPRLPEPSCGLQRFVSTPSRPAFGEVEVLPIHTDYSALLPDCAGEGDPGRHA